VSVESLAIALHHSKATGTAKLVLIGIANHDGDGGAWPSIATLARYAGVDARNARKAIQRLEDLGEIRRHIQGGGTAQTPEHRRPNWYAFLLECPPTCDRTRQHKTRNHGVLDAPFAPPAERGSDSSGEDGSDRGPLTVAPSEPSTNQPIDTAQEKSHVPNARATDGRDLAPCGHKLVTDRHCEHGCRPRAEAVA
jgi:hypothetical protein